MKKQLFVAATAVFALASCTTSDEVFTGEQQLAEQTLDDNAIQFGMYLGQTPSTRAGAEGSINTNILKGFDKDGSDASWTEDKAKKFGFGVFAYYTGNQTYNDWTTYPAPATPVVFGTGTTVDKKYPNFMYNEQVWYNKSAEAGSITNWKYALTKYWPNEVGAGAVDDQENDAGNDPATTVNNYGGNLSFFAYAPYVEAGSASYGITAIRAKDATGDPIISYAINPEGEKVVDLLWGTLGSAGPNVVGGANAGVSYSNDASATNYEKSILPHATGATTYDGYTLPADLTKQKTNGKVEFAFKHALAKVGGSETYSTIKDPSDNSITHGLMIQLDIDDMKGAEVGGEKQDDTKVTVVDVRIAAKSLVADGSSKTPESSSYTRTYLNGIAAGDLNLATGYWNITSTTTEDSESAATTNHIIASPASTSASLTGVATLNDDIAEPASWASWSSYGSKKGVEVAKKNVYKDETAPLVFIPGTYPELTIVIDYIVRTKDTKLADGYSQVRQVIAKRVTFTNPVELNKQYNLLMHLGLTSVKFDATVSDWQVNGDTNGDGTIDGGATPAEELIIEDAYLPRNVGEIAKTVAFSAGTTTTYEVPYGTTSVAVTFTGLDNSAFTTSNHQASNKLTPASGTVDGGTQTVTITMPANTGVGEDVNSFGFTNNGSTHYIRVVQAPAPLTVKATHLTYSNLSRSSFDPVWSIKDAAGNDITSGLTYSTTSSWLTINPTSGAVTFGGNAGAGCTTRTAEVKVTHTNGATGTVIITQNN